MQIVQNNEKLLQTISHVIINVKLFLNKHKTACQNRKNGRVPIVLLLLPSNLNKQPAKLSPFCRITLQQPSQMYQKNENSAKHDQVPPYKVTKMVHMGFSREESEVSLAATGGSIEQSVQLLSEARVAQDANVVAS